MIDFDQHLTYGHLGLNLKGQLEVDRKNNTWSFYAEVFPNARMGVYQGRNDLPILDQLDLNPYAGSDPRKIDERVFSLLRFSQEKSGIGADFPIIAETEKEKDGTVSVIPGRLFLGGVLPSELSIQK